VKRRWLSFRPLNQLEEGPKKGPQWGGYEVAERKGCPDSKPNGRLTSGFEKVKNRGINCFKSKIIRK